MQIYLSFKILVFLLYITNKNVNADDDEVCSIENKEDCDSKTATFSENQQYSTAENLIIESIENALATYEPCANDTIDFDCKCHAAVIERDLQPFKDAGITRNTIRDSSKYGTRYQIFNNRLYRDVDCMFPARCNGIEHFLLQLLGKLPNMDLIINTRDYPAIRNSYGLRAPVFSFSKTADYYDIMYPAWTFWEGGPAISLYPTGIGRWDLQRDKITKAADKWSWENKIAKGFFRGSRTSDERDALVLLSRRKPNLVNAQYTKNQAWKSPKDTLNAEPAKEISFEGHCQFKYLFNFRGIAASFRFKHLFLCKSLVFHVGDEWNEFFYFAMKPWVHYVPVKSYPTESELEELLLFFQRHDSLAKSIAERGYDFIWQHLRMQDIECYWKNLLLSYSKLMKYNTTRTYQLHEITSKRIKY